MRTSLEGICASRKGYPPMFLLILVCALSGIGAGIGTGLAGLSAALIIAPSLMTFCDMPAYEAVTIALASDVLASAISAWTYGKRKNMDIKNGIMLLAAILVFTIVGSYIGQFVPNTIVKYFAIFMICAVGTKFVIWPVMTSKTEMATRPFRERVTKSIFFGAIIGFICGFVGVGGGAMMLIVLTAALGFELKTAIGTSVFIMSFTALLGAVSHFALGATPDPLALAICVVFTFVAAQLSAIFANKTSLKRLNKVVGFCLLLFAVILVLLNIFGKTA